ncbi:coiled-coil domain-containing protein 157 isoform X2 [Pezoporus flaviventris]|uniref:coiled-coil domain-containing protein 157 isoform X2 n=1 Tax=Pezoporus flaviventris TaxID=889875 RepID=UPI002AAFE56C|nr:coiled-coil domain-containing protein 157 isoform X2 [Pezoporus flaviventris]
MAHLLGHPGCMESLRADLRDLQAAIADVSSRAGAVRVPSWKFPDQVSCELDVAALLERYRYSPGDPEVSQHGHVVLLELLIDRLLLLLQTFTGYAEELLSDRAVPPARALAPGMSAGLTVRRYWCCMLKLGAFYQQLLAEKASRKESPALPSSPQAGTPENEPLKHCLSSVLEPRSSQDIAPSTSLCLPSTVLPLASGASGSSLPRPANSVPMQPPGASLGLCATCTSIQGCLHEVGKAITSICQSQNIPSALSRFQEAVGDTAGSRTLSATDVRYWASEQSKDLSRISKHLQMLLQQVQPLQAELQESEKQKEKLQRQVEDMAWLLQVEKDTHVQQQKEAQQSLEAKNKEHLEAVGRLEQAKDDLQRGVALLEEQVSTLKEELAGKQAAVQELETAKATLLEEMRTTMVARSQVLALEEKLQLLSSQHESLGQELGTTTTQLQKERAKVESMERHQESLQAKQRTLLQQLDSLDQEREELQLSLGEAEEDKARLQEQLQESREQHRQQQELLDTLQQEKLGLERAVSELQENVSRLQEQARELQERERLLVFFPELHVPTEAQFESTGSLTEDMKRQLQANSIRIGVLEQENARLSTALGKVNVAAQEGVLKLIPQSQLWSQLSQCSRDTVRQDKGPPSSRDSAGTQGRTGTKGHTATRGCTGDTRQRAPSSQRAKPLWAQPTSKARCSPLLVAEGLVLSPSEPRGRARPLSSPHTRGHCQ